MLRNFCDNYHQHAKNYANHFVFSCQPKEVSHLASLIERDPEFQGGDVTFPRSPIDQD